MVNLEMATSTITTPEAIARQHGWKIRFYRRSTGVVGFSTRDERFVFVNWLRSNDYEVIDHGIGEVLFFRKRLARG